MLRHVAVFRFKPGTTDAQIAAIESQVPSCGGLSDDGQRAVW
jgi:hypothetical protein